jgi:cyanophycinase
MKLSAVILLAAVVVGQQSQTATVPTTLTRGPLFDHYFSGNPVDVAPPTTGGLLLAGGGTDQPEAFRWLFEHAGGGDIVILRASGADGYHPFVMRLGGVNSIATYVVRHRDAASDPRLLGALGRAEAIFFAGGDQSKYIGFFKDTLVEAAVNDAARRGVPIGGTSAGLAILGEFSFAALRSSTTTDEATKEPYHPNVTLERDFLSLPFMSGIITDSHVIERGRLGRTVTFMARLKQDGWLGTRPARAIAIDRETAILVEADGSATVVGPKTAFFMQAADNPQVCSATEPLSYHPIEVYAVSRGATFHLSRWTGTGGTVQQMSVREGIVTGPTSVGR